MSRAVITNISIEALPLPAVFGSRVLPPDRSFVVDETAANVIAQMGGDAAIAGIWDVADTSSAAGIDIVDAADNQSLILAGAIDLTHLVTRLGAHSAGVVVTLANGYLGQEKWVYVDVVEHTGTDTMVVTPTSGGPWTVAAVGDWLHLKFDGTTWYLVSSRRFGVVGDMGTVGTAACGVSAKVAHADHTHALDPVVGPLTITGKWTLNNLLATDFGITANATPIAGTALGTVRSIIGSMAVSNAGVVSGTVAGVRGIVTLTGSIASGPVYMYGSQGRAVLDGVTLAAGSGHICASMAQMSASGTTVTDGHVAPLIVSGQNLPTSAYVNMIYCESGGGKVNAVLQSNVKSTYIFDLNNFESGGNIAAAGTAGGSAGNSTHCAANRVLVCLIDGSAGYIPVFNSNA